MQPQEIDIALEELENRLDRLRSLYEQYFLGIEKIEPSVARKDVDRRFWILRKLQIRNTARRFRLQVLVQRYNTFQQYWTRICRDIENGVYIRHLLKAQKKLGAEPKTWAAKKRLGLLGRQRPSAPPPDTAGADALPAGVSGSEGARPTSGAALDPEAARLASEALVTAEKLSSLRLNATGVSTQTRSFADLGPLDLDFDDAPPSVRPKRAAPTPNAPAKPAPAAPRVAAANAASAKPLATTPSRPEAPAKAVTRPASAGLSDDRLRQLHSELVATKRKLNQGDSVSIEALVKSVRATEAKLLAEHQGRTVDFQVVVKDGKPVVKPVVRK